jgi:hypothetical protein
VGGEGPKEIPISIKKKPISASIGYPSLQVPVYCSAFEQIQGDQKIGRQQPSTQEGQLSLA